MDDVKVHYNSDKPAQLQAHAYAQGTDIHLGAGKEKHLAHEAWHVVQQKQGRVKPTVQMKGKVNVNDDAGLEKEADVMGAKALQMKGNKEMKSLNTTQLNKNYNTTIQYYKYPESKKDIIVYYNQDSEEELVSRMERIDYILVSSDLLPKCTGAKVHNEKENWFLSDHYPVSATFMLKK